MPSFNSQGFIAAAIESVISQKFRFWELIIVDGGSTDQTLSIVMAYVSLDDRIKVLKNENDQGPAHARANGIRRAQGEYIAFLDSDDLWLTNKLDLQLSFMENNGINFSYTRYRTLYPDGKAGGLIPMSKSYTYNQYLRRRGIGNLTVMACRSLFSESILSTIRRAGGEDTLWWLLILKDGSHAYLVDVDLARYRSTPGSLSKNQVYTLQTVWSMYRNELKLSQLNAVVVFVSYVIDVSVRRLRTFYRELL